MSSDINEMLEELAFLRESLSATRHRFSNSFLYTLRMSKALELVDDLLDDLAIDIRKENA